MYGAFQPSHLILILIVVLIIFGPGKMQGLGKNLGESMRDFRKALNEGDAPEDKVDQNKSA